MDSRIYNVKIYNKGKLDINRNYVTLKNVGRESQTYVQYIIDNYNSLPNVSVFLQGNPLEHIFNIEDIIKSANLHPSGMSQNANLNTHVGPNMASSSFTIKIHNGARVTPYFDMSYGQWWEHVIKKPFPNKSDHRWYIGACFAATRQAIKSVSLETWIAINDSLQDINPVTGHYMERSWYCLMNQHIPTKNERKYIL